MTRILLGTTLLLLCANLILPLGMAEEIDPALKFLLDPDTRLLPERASQWRCDPLTKLVCTSKGCQPQPLSVWVNLNFENQIYERCDPKGCTSRGLTYSPGASIYTDVSLVGVGASFLRVANDGSEYTEVMSLTTNLFVSFGRCEPQ